MQNYTKNLEEFEVYQDLVDESTIILNLLGRCLHRWGYCLFLEAYLLISIRVTDISKIFCKTA